MAKSKIAVNSKQQQGYLRLKVLAVEIKRTYEEVSKAAEVLAQQLMEAQQLCEETGTAFRRWLNDNGISRSTAYRRIAEAKAPALADQRREKSRDNNVLNTHKVSHVGHVNSENSSTCESSAPATTFREPVTVEGEATEIPEPVAASEPPTEAQRTEFYRQRSRHEALNDIAGSDDKLAKALERIDMLTQQLAAMTISRDGRMEEQNKLKAAFKDKNRQIAALERKLKAKDEELTKKEAELEALKERLAIRLDGAELPKPVRPS